MSLDNIYAVNGSLGKFFINLLFIFYFLKFISVKIISNLFILSSLFTNFSFISLFYSLFTILICNYLTSNILNYLLSSLFAIHSNLSYLVYLLTYTLLQNNSSNHFRQLHFRSLLLIVSGFITSLVNFKALVPTVIYQIGGFKFNYIDLSIIFNLLTLGFMAFKLIISI